jgi:hypothetical protein
MLGGYMMIDADKLIWILEDTIAKIVEDMESNPGPNGLVQPLEATRAKVLTDLVEAIKVCKMLAPRESCITVESFRKQRAEDSWSGRVDRQSGAFDESEYQNPSNWR